MARLFPIVATLLYCVLSAGSLSAQDTATADETPAATEATMNPTTPPAATTAPMTTTSSSYLGGGRQWKAGPHISTSLIHPLLFGGDFTWGKEWAGALSFGRFNYAPDAGDDVEKLDLTLQNIEVVGSWFPWLGSFHVDGGLGQQKIAVDATSKQDVKAGGADGEVLTLSGDFEMISTYLYAGVGWLWRYDFGLTVGTGLGLQLPVSSSSNFNVALEDSGILDEAIKSTAAYNELKDATVKAGETAGMLAMPRIEIIRVGYLF